MSNAAPEAERRLRAALRALLSRGVWCVVGAQLCLVVLWRQFLSVNATGGNAGIFFLAPTLAGFLYLTAGVSQALASGRDIVGLRPALRAGVSSYGPFLWMIAKLALLSGIVLNAAVYYGTAPGTAEPPSWFAQISGYLPLFQGLIGFAFVYWLPIVFVRRNFALFKTLRAALTIAWQRLPRAGYLAFLTLTPALVAVVAGDSTPLIAVLLLNLVGGLMEWIAYVYCVGWLQDQSTA